jgi:hypothetical protein
MININMKNIVSAQNTKIRERAKDESFRAWMETAGQPVVVIEENNEIGFSKNVSRS